MLHGLWHLHFARGIQQKACFLLLAMRRLGDSFTVEGLEAICLGTEFPAQVG